MSQSQVRPAVAITATQVMFDPDNALSAPPIQRANLLILRVSKRVASSPNGRERNQSEVKLLRDVFKLVLLREITCPAENLQSLLP